MSRGYGRWQKELVRAVGGVHTATVAGVVRTCVPEPDRSDYTAARRAAKTLALEQTLVALYVYACQRCGHVQDHEPERCCGVVRSSLAVTRPGRAQPYLALPPTGTSCPAWIGINVASRLQSPPGRLTTPSIDDLATLVIRRCWEGLQSGRPAVSVQAAVAILRLAHEIEHDAALAERDAARRQMEEWRQEFKSGLWAVRSVGSTGQTPGRRSRPSSRSSVLLRRGNRQPGSAGCLLAVRHSGGRSPRAGRGGEGDIGAEPAAFQARPARSPRSAICRVAFRRRNHMRQPGSSYSKRPG
jgi:hypothetical protein